MAWSEIIFGSLLVAVLLLLAGFFGWRQFVVLRRLRLVTLPLDEAVYERRKAHRRLLSCALLLVLAALLAAALFLFDSAFLDTPPDERSQELIQRIRIWGSSWVAILALLLIVVAIAAVDLWSTRRHGMQQLRKLQADRRAMLHRQTMHLREERDQQK